MSANVVSVHLVAHYQRFTRQVRTLFGVIFQMDDNSVNLICLYKSLEIMMINIHFTVNRLFVLDICLYWNK